MYDIPLATVLVSRSIVIAGTYIIILNRLRSHIEFKVIVTGLLGFFGNLVRFSLTSAIFSNFGRFEFNDDKNRVPK